MVKHLLRSGASVRKDLILASTFSSTTLRVIPWLGEQGFGTTQTPATQMSLYAQGGSFNKASTAIVIAGSSNPFIHAYAYSTATGFGAKFANPAVVPQGSSVKAVFSPDETAVAVASNTSPYVAVYRWSAAGFGTKFADPVTLPEGSAYCVVFSPTGGHILIGHVSPSYNSIYSFNSTTGFGTKSAFSGQINSVHSLTFSPDGRTLLLANNSANPLQAFPWTATGPGTRYANPTPAAPQQGRGCSFSPHGNAVAVSHFSSPYITAYSWNNTTGFGPKYADPSFLATQTGVACAFSPDAEWLLLAANSLIAYKFNADTGFGSTHFTQSFGSFANGDIRFNLPYHF
jgi:WD40 repeat protein